MDKIKDEYTILERIGQGTYSIVYKCRRDSTGQIFAIKQLRWSKQQLIELLPSYTRQVEIMRIFSHQNIVNFIEEFEYMNRVYLVTEYCESGDLVKYMKNHKPMKEEVLRIIGEMIEGLCYIHAKGYMHRDLKPDNVFIGEGYAVKIGDYGMGKKFQTGMRNTQQIGTPLYAAPAILKGRGEYTPKCDVFSLGLIIYYIIFRSHLFKPAKDSQQLQDLQYKMLRKENKNKFFNNLNCDDVFKEVLEKCLTYEENHRWTIFELIDWFSKRTGLKYENPFPNLFDKSEKELCNTMLKYFRIVGDEIEAVRKKYIRLADEINANKYQFLPTSDRYMLVYSLIGSFICENAALVNKFRDDYFRIGQKIINWKLDISAQFKIQRNKFIEIYGNYYLSFAQVFTDLSKNIIRCVKDDSWGKDLIRGASAFLQSRKMQGTTYYKKQIREYVKTHYDLTTNPTKQCAELKHWLKIAFQ